MSDFKSTCGNKYCCNPFHLIPQNIGVFVDDESYIESFELAVQIHTLRQQIIEYQMDEALKEEEPKNVVQDHGSSVP